VKGKMPLANSGDLWQIQRKDTEVGGWKAVAYVRASTCSCSCPMYSPFLNLAQSWKRLKYQN